MGVFRIGDAGDLNYLKLCSGYEKLRLFEVYLCGGFRNSCQGIVRVRLCQEYLVQEKQHKKQKKSCEATENVHSTSPASSIDSSPSSPYGSTRFQQRPYVDRPTYIERDLVDSSQLSTEALLEKLSENLAFEFVTEVCSCLFCFIELGWVTSEGSWILGKR